MTHLKITFGFSVILLPILLTAPAGAHHSHQQGAGHSPPATNTDDPSRIPEKFRTLFLAIAFSPDGKMIATAHNDGIRLWDRSGKELRRIGRQIYVRFLAFACGGKYLVSGSGRDVSVWEAADGKFVRRLCETGEKEPLTDLSATPFGTLVVTNRYRGIDFWDVETGKKLRPRLGEWRANSSALSPDGRRFAWTDKGSIHVEEAATGKKCCTLHAKGDLRLSHLRFSPDGRFLAVLAAHKSNQDDPDKRPFDPRHSEVHVARMWELASGQYLGLDADAGRVRFASDGRTLTVRGDPVDNIAVGLWDVTRWKRLPGLPRRDKDSHDVIAISPDGKVLAVGGLNLPLRLWDLQGKLSPAWEARDLSPKDLERLWDDLGSTDLKAARHAVWALVASPASSVPMLRERLQPIPRADTKRIQALIADLGNPKHQARERAFEELEALGRLAESAVKEVLAKPPALEVQERLQRLVKTWEPAGSTPRKLRNLRAIEALEHIGTSQARAALRALSVGAPGAAETEDAIMALERLERRSPK